MKSSFFIIFLLAFVVVLGGTLFFVFEKDPLAIITKGGDDAKSQSAIQDAPLLSERKGISLYGITFLPGQWAGEWPWVALRNLGIGWVRLDFWMGEPGYGQHTNPRILRTISEGYGLWLTLYHRDRSNVQDQERFQHSKRGGFPALDATRYQELIRETVQPLVEKIRLQGKNPTEWLVIQIENEVVPEDVLPPDPMRFWHGNSDQYLEHLKRSYKAVKAIDQSIQVAMGGIASEALEIFIKESAPGAGADWIERLLREGRFDIADVHLYHSIDTIPAKIAWVRKRWKGLLAASEVGGPDERTGVTYSETLHAKDLPHRIQTVREAGINWVFWLSLTEAPTADRLGQTIALTKTDGTRKSAFEAYRKLISETSR